MNEAKKEAWYYAFKNREKTKVIVILVAIIAVIIAGIIIWIVIANKDTKDRDLFDDVILSGEEPQAQVVELNTTMEDIITISELRGLESSYTAVCRVYSEVDNTSPVYYIAYDATVVLGINTEDIEIDYGDEKDKTITVILPRVVILDSVVNAGTLDYLFIDNSYNNHETSIQAQSRCEQDLLSRVREDDKMFLYAKDNTEAEIRALTEPLMKQLYPEYDLNIIWREG
ncbi:MAG: DUF4230 domain-containing protein [Clostridiales bacterium]|nr:DUF4230 domain-containing protein [Clostridiales bacterium]